MPMLTYKLTIEVPIAGPNGDPPSREEIMMLNETTGQAKEMIREDARSLYRFIDGAWLRGVDLT